MQALCDDWTQGSPAVFAVLDGHKAYPEIPKGNMNDDIEEQGPVQGWCQEIHLFAQAAPRMCPICVLTPHQSREGIACRWPPTFVPIGTIRTATAARSHLRRVWSADAPAVRWLLNQEDTPPI